MSTERSWVAIQHVPFEGPGSIATAAARRETPLAVCHPYLGEPLPACRELCGLVVMGGPMGVSDTDSHPYLRDELALIAASVAAGLPVLGVCLGAQLLAAALGARVYRGPQLEIGPGTVALTDAGRSDPVLGAAGRAELPVVHWHQDTFELPPGAAVAGPQRALPAPGLPRRARARTACSSTSRSIARWQRAGASTCRRGSRSRSRRARDVEGIGDAALAAFFALAGR